MLTDADQRTEATDPCASFIVQAPAGSGKTEILTQRYLRLLSTVTAPEQIIALTFTRKAAHEMRERILEALQKVEGNHAAQTPHQQKTFTYAKAALEHSRALRWNLLQQTQRLKIATLDALCQQINQSIPLQDQQIAYARVTDQPQAYYVRAARQCIQCALTTPAYQQAITALLLHLDNRQDRLLGLFAALLTQRDAWLAPLFQAKDHGKEYFEQALLRIQTHAVERLRKSLPPAVANELLRLAGELAHLVPYNALQAWTDWEALDAAKGKALANILLTREHLFRKAFDHHVGLKKECCPPAQYKTLKGASTALLAELSTYPDFLHALLQVHYMPAPEYEAGQWAVLQALFQLLPMLVAQLHVGFAQTNAIDFTGIAQQAQTALGTQDNPTDLALYLDHAVHHLLVDEFQDTSINQFALLTQLVQGWQPHDGKTLFIVGDPMQSIYRFRQAEVGLFFRAKAHGIGPVKLRALQLQSNFRSDHALVAWVNQHFAYLFPKTSDIASGAVSFHPAISQRGQTQESAVQAWQCQDKEDEARQLIAQLTLVLEKYPQQSVAILVRSRTHLTEIMRLLRVQGIPFQGTDIDLLAHLPHLRDVFSLTQALLYPANRLAWLALLRSPLCGLSLHDLHCIAACNKKQSIYQTLLDLDRVEGVSHDGRVRANFLTQVMQAAMARRAQTCLTEWVEHTVQALQGDKLFTKSQWDDIHQLLALLHAYAQDGRIPDMQAFVQAFNNLYSKQAKPSLLQVMTIHKSKGLEFDTVFLPGLGALPKKQDAPLLRWLTLPTPDESALFLLSPVHAAEQEACAVYDYLGRLEAEKANFETQRVLYVAVTRAKSRLYLFTQSEKAAKGSFQSLLTQQPFIPVDSADVPHEHKPSLPQVAKLPLTHYASQPIVPPQPTNPSSPLVSSLPRLVGIVAHQLLQWVCDNHPTTLDGIPWQLATHAFQQLGLDTTATQEAYATLQHQLRQLFLDPIGLWIIQPHTKERNEYEILVKHQGKLNTHILDRTFECDNALWIIDFKTGQAEHLAQYQHQLNTYARYLATNTQLPIHCGLYYLSTSQWVTWRFTAASVVDNAQVLI